MLGTHDAGRTGHATETRGGIEQDRTGAPNKNIVQNHLNIAC